MIPVRPHYPNLDPSIVGQVSDAAILGDEANIAICNSERLHHRGTLGREHAATRSLYPQTIMTPKTAGKRKIEHTV